LPARLSEPATLAQILQTIDEAPEMPAQEDLNALFSELQASALATIFEWLGRIRNPQLRSLLEVAADRLAGANTSELVRLIAQAQGLAAIEAVRRAGALKTAAAVGPLAKLLGDPLRELRLAAVAALVEIGSAGALQTLERALADSDRDIRMTAVRAIGSRGARSALPRIDSMVKSKELRAADLTERMAFFEAFGELCGDGGVAFLDGLLNGKSGLLGRREDPEVRACAAIALGHVKSPRAQQSLQKAMSEKDVIVRNAVNRALRGGAA
jgi:HEAT repeat protein